MLTSLQPDGVNRIHSLKYLRSTKFGCSDIGIRKSEFVRKTFVTAIIDISLKRS